MSREMERVLLTHCAPTLAGLKCANLVRLTGPRAELEAAAQAWRATLAPRGVHVRTARWDGDSALLYLYREGHLQREWEKPGAADFLRRHGYEPGAAVQENVELLLRRIARRPCFPHEIGLFLGYPLEDVQGFIENCGKNYRLCGCWKVYGDPQAALRCFARYEKCARVYLQCYQNGHSLSRLTVAG